jgi:Family of unknown function (DUF5372)
VTHRFHPLFGRELEFVKRRRNYGDDLVYVYGVDGELLPLPAQWTDAVPADPFVEAAAGHAPFRTGDLLELADRVAELAARVASEDAAGVRRILP